MMKKKISFIQFIRIWGIIFLLGVGLIFIFLDVGKFYYDFDTQAARIRSDYIDNQKQIVKQEVIRVAETIRYLKSQSEALTREKIRERVYEAYAIAQHIYHQNQHSQTKTRIQQLIIDALRPIRFQNGIGYYFATEFDGIEILFSDRPQLEGQNLLNMQDTRGRYVIRDMIAIAKSQNEGFYAYHWTKPGAQGNDFKKISFIKRFAPLNCFIGTGLYVDDIEEQIKAQLLSDVSRIRFGKEGYIFINRLNGDALVSNGKLFSGTKKLWEEFNENPDQMREIFDKEYRAALKPQGDFIEYAHVKLSEPGEKKQKYSFILGLPEFQWLAGSGFYLDDVEKEIAGMNKALMQRMKIKIIYFALTVIIVFGLFFLVFSRLNQRLKSDLIMFGSFFKKAALSDKKIDRDHIKFEEFDRIAKYANKMLSDRIQAVKTLKESEAKYRRLAENAKDMIYRMSLPGGDYEYVSPASVNLTGYAPEEFYADPSIIQKIIHPDWQNYFREQWGNLLVGNMPSFYEYQIIHISGEERWMYQRNVLIRGKDGQPVAIEGIITDITNRKQAEQKLKKSEQELQTVLATSPVGLGLVIDRKMDWGNATIYKMFGWEPGSLMGKGAQVLYPDDREYKRVGQLLYSGIVQSGVGQAEALCKKKDGTIFNCLIQITAIDRSEPEKGQIVSMIDITDRKKAEREREKLQDQLAQAHKMESIGRLAGGVAHDFNNMLSIILGNAQMMLDDLAAGNPLIEKLEEIEKAAQRSTNLTRQLLAFARKQSISPEVRNLNDVIEGMLQMLRRLIGEDIDLSWHPGPDLWLVKIDPSQVDQILANLCVNARDSITDVGKIIIGTANRHFDTDYCKNNPEFKPGGYIEVTVSDNGCGMDKETQDNLFEPFFTTKKREKGTGLGLAMIYGIVEQNGGFIRVLSEVDQGTTFKIYLPRYVGQAITKKTAPEMDANQRGCETILLVEDEAAILTMTKKMLERLGYKVLAANTPDEALRLSNTSKMQIHLLMTDVVMPSMNGRDLAEKIIKSYPGMKCLYMSGYTADVIAHRGILDEGLHFISKPFTIHELSVQLRKIFD